MGCGAKRPKGTLLRVVLDSEGRPRLDPSRRASGRGAYLCGAGCLVAAQKRKAFQRAFRGKARVLDLGELEAALKSVEAARNLK